MATASKRTAAAPSERLPAAPAPVRRRLRETILDREAIQLAALRAYHGFIRNRGLDSAAALSFFAALVLFPASLTVVSAFALLDNRSHATADILRIVDGVAPHATVDTLHGPIRQLLTVPNPGYALFIGVALTIWTLSGYITAFGRAINTAYERQEGRRWLPLRASMLLVSAALVVVGALIVVLVAGTPAVAASVARTLGVPHWIVVLWDIAKWPVLAALAILVVAILYYFSPNVRHLRVRWVTMGALLAIVVWVLATTGFAIYVLNFSHYNRVYGWLGGAVVLLLWLYLTNLVVVFGAEMDAEIVRIRQLIAGIDAENAVQLPDRSTKRLKILDRWDREDAKKGRTFLAAEKRKRARAGASTKR